MKFVFPTPTLPTSRSVKGELMKPHSKKGVWGLGGAFPRLNSQQGAFAQQGFVRTIDLAM